MNINWKDFSLMYLIGYIVFLALGLGFGIANVTIVLSAAYGLSFAFYFLKNKSELNEAAGISFIFGFTFVPSFLVLYVLAAPVFGSAPAASGSEVDWIDVIIKLVELALITMFCGLLVWFLAKYAKKK